MPGLAPHSEDAVRAARSALQSRSGGTRCTPDARLSQLPFEGIVPAFRRHSRSARRAAGPVAGRRGRGRRRRHAPAGRPAQRCRQPRAAAVRLARFARRRQLPVPDRGRPGLQFDDRGLRDTRLNTANTRATIKTAVPNGTYWWRVRAVTKAGQVSGWSKPRSVRKAWTAAPTLRGPGERGARLLPGSAADALLGAGAAGRQVSRLARDRPGSRLTRGRRRGRDRRHDVRAVADSVGRQGQDLLLGRHPARRTR